MTDRISFNSQPVGLGQPSHQGTLAENYSWFASKDLDALLTQNMTIQFAPGATVENVTRAIVDQLIYPHSESLS
jgi:hypothetical protein